jgi:M6 family metalloprotease-like protein
VGFPLDGNTPATGNIRVALIPIDFPDATGTEQELLDAQVQINLFNEWIASQSRSTLTVDWQTYEHWLRAPKPSSDYGLDPETVYAAIGGDARDYVSLVETFSTEMVDLADPFIDFTDNQFVYFLFPKTIVDIDPHVGNFHLSIPSDEGTIAKVWGGGAFFYKTLDYYQDAHELWSVWVHEIGHTWGLAGHAPVAILGTEQELASYDTDLHLMGTQDALHKVFSVWDQWLLGWLPENEVYCLPAPQLDTTDVELVALERSGESGYRTAMIPLTESSILVVESHRSDGYGARAAPLGNAVVVYVVDTTLDYDRSLESGGGITLDRFAFYLAPSLTDAERSERGSSSRARRDPFLILGESVTYEGVTVTVAQSDEHDVVRITRNG